MSDLISRADAKKEVYLLGKNPSINEIWDCLDALPSADAVQVPDWLIEWSKDYVRECMKQLKEEIQNDTSVKHSR